MTWVVAHIVSVAELISGEQTKFPTFEEMYLIEAHSDEEYQNSLGRIVDLINEAGECTVDDMPARIKVIGVRKVSTIYNPPPYTMDADKPVHGTEVASIEYEFSKIADAKKFADGTSMEVKVIR